MAESKHPISDLLRFDPLSAAEELTGESYKTSKSTEALGFCLMQEHSRIKNAALMERGDTMLSNDTDRYLSIVASIGFEEALTIPFRSHEQDETFRIYARHDGILLAFDTFGNKRINGGHFYYNWHPGAEAISNRPEGILSSYHLMKRPDGNFTPPITVEDIFVGYHDCREALVFNIDRLTQYGSFANPWRERPFLWLLHHGDPKGHDVDYQSINRERIALLPAWVREFIGPEDSNG